MRYVLEGALSAYACACIKSTSARRKVGLAPKRRMKNEWNKCFYEVKGGVGMSNLVPWLSLC